MHKIEQENPEYSDEAIQGGLRNSPSIYFLHNHSNHPILSSLNTLNCIVAYSVMKTKMWLKKKVQASLVHFL